MALFNPTTHSLEQHPTLLLHHHHHDHHCSPSSSLSSSSLSVAILADGSEGQPNPSSTNSIPHSCPTAAHSTLFQPNSASLSASSDQLFKHRQSTLSTSSARVNISGLLNLAALARDRTSSVIANFADPGLRSRHSSGNLSGQSPSTTSIASACSLTLPNSSVAPITTLKDLEGSVRQSRPGLPRLSSSTGNISESVTLHSRTPKSVSSLSRQRHSLLDTDPPSQSYKDTDSNTTKPIAYNSAFTHNTMHQTSSRLLRMTDDERPFTRVSSSVASGSTHDLGLLLLGILTVGFPAWTSPDNYQDFKDLFSTLIVSLPLAPHRIRLTRIDNSFLSEEAINNLGSLKFSQSNRMPDPKDPSRIVTTTTTTTFSMAREMARSVCQRFLEARFIESADGKQAREFSMKGGIWQLTPKGIHILDRFCSRNGIQQKHIGDLLMSGRNTMHLVILERDNQTDKLSSDRSTIEVLFRRFIGKNGPNVKSSTTNADSDSITEYKDGMSGVKMAGERKLGSPPRTVFQTFTGRAATDWLMDCCTVVDRRETVEIASLFMDQDLLWCVQSDRSYLNQYPADAKFQPSKNAIYQMTAHGKDVINMIGQRLSGGDEPREPRAGVSRDSNTQKLDKILNDAALRLLFREQLIATHCEENLSFYMDVDEFLSSCKNSIKVAASSRTGTKPSAVGLDGVKETMASAYGIYNAFLAPGSPCELNIDHLLRNQLATRMTKAVGLDTAMVDSLREVAKLFEEAQVSVFKLMASDSVPKFMKSPVYEQTLKNYDFDSVPGGVAPTKYNGASTPPERSMSKSAR